METILYKTKYIVLETIEEWQTIVNVINVIRNYPNNENGTLIYLDAPIMSAQIIDENDIVIVESKFVLPVLADLQEFNSELFANYTLVETFEQQINNNNE